jgi:chromosome segregation ATPase
MVSFAEHLSITLTATQAPKATPPSAKRALMLAWIQKSGTAHTIKDLEKALPGVGSVSSIQVKDFVQAMLDENEIKVEKIGSGNWYWSFPGEETARREQALAQAQAEHDKAAAALAEAKASVNEATRACEEQAADEEGEGESRTEMLERHTVLKKEVEEMGCELAKYVDSDPVELEIQNERASTMRAKSEAYSDQIHSLADWIRDKAGVDRETLTGMKRKWYGDQFDEEDQDLRELQ